MKFQIAFETRIVRMLFQKMRNFGRAVFAYYEKHPVLMSSSAGGAVYFGGELFVQLQSKGSLPLEYKRLAEVTTLGTAENGVVMLAWYTLNFLS